jgi:hypothetical protein
MTLRGLDLRQGVADLNDLAAHDLSALWREVADAAQAAEALRDILPGLIDAYGSAAAAMAADWYDDLRAKVGVPGSFTAIPADIPDVGAPALIGWASSTATDDAAFRSLIEGGMQRRIANFSRLTVMGSSTADPRARGWQRVGEGACRNGFCDMLIARGAVYTEATADFAAHDHCKCQAVPAFGGEPLPVKPYTPSTRRTSDADRATVREWLASH